jgi:type VI secretion system secreted protein Hcp
MAIYMQYKGIDGDATQSGFKNWIRIDSFQFGVGRPITTHTGAALNRDAHEPSISEITVTKQVDKASGPMLQSVCTDKKGQDCKIAFVSQGDPGEQYLQYTLTNTLISGLSVHSNGSDRPNESVSLNFTKLEIEVKPLSTDNSAEGPFKFAYDIAQAKKA